MITSRPTLPGDRWLIAGDLRPAEVDEFAALGVTSEDCMALGAIYSDAETLFIDGEIAGMLGIMRYERENVLWGVFTQVIDRHPLPFLRFCKRYVAALDCIVCNSVDARNTKAVQWFRWLGFTVSEPFMVNGFAFHQVTTAREERKVA